MGFLAPTDLSSNPAPQRFTIGGSMPLPYLPVWDHPCSATIRPSLVAPCLYHPFVRHSGLPTQVPTSGQHSQLISAAPFRLAAFWRHLLPSYQRTVWAEDDTYDLW